MHSFLAACLAKDCTKTHANSQGALVINALASVEVMNDKNETRYPNRFKVTDGSDGHFTEISADTAPQMNEWVKAINKVSSASW